MKILFFSFLLFFISQTELLSQAEFELEPSQVMLMTGKGPGQDGAINPYYGQDCYAIVENMDNAEFEIRIQQKGKIISMIPVKAKETKKITLLKDHELYIDGNVRKAIKLKLDFKVMDSE